jgi:hypothetical protein
MGWGRGYLAPRFGRCIIIDKGFAGGCLVPSSFAKVVVGLGRTLAGFHPLETWRTACMTSEVRLLAKEPGVLPSTVRDARCALDGCVSMSPARPSFADWHQRLVVVFVDSTTLLPLLLCFFYWGDGGGGGVRGHRPRVSRFMNYEPRMSGLS